MILCTVPHTGTTFFEKLLGFEKFHCDEEQYALQALRTRKPLFTTIRHPFVVEVSWKRRGKSVRDLIRAFEIWREMIYPQAHVLSVDSPRRDELLPEGVETDWKPERVVSDTHDLKWQDLTPSVEVWELSERMAHILGEYYW